MRVANTRDFHPTSSEPLRRRLPACARGLPGPQEGRQPEPGDKWTLTSGRRRLADIIRAW